VIDSEFTAPAPAESSPVEYASFARRLGAALLDSLVWLVGLSFLNPFAVIENETAGAIVAFVILSAWFNYFAFCEWQWGQTIGKNATGIRVLPLEGGRLTWQAAAVRNLLRLVDLPLAMVGVGYLLVRGSPRHQRLGDRAAKTIVVREGRKDQVSEPPAPAEQRAGTPQAAATASEIFGDAAEALAMHPAAGSAPRAGPEPPPSEGGGPPPSVATASPVPPPAAGGEVAAAPSPASSWTAAGFPYSTWTVRRTLWGLLVGLLVGGLFAPLLVVPFDPDLDSTGALLAAQTLLSVTLVSVAIAVASDRGEIVIRRDLSLLGLRRFRPSAFGWLALAYFSYFVFIAIYASLVTPPEQEDIARDLGLEEGVAAAIPVVLLIAVAAPIAEEIFFRGMLFGGLRRGMSMVPAAAISALVFGGLHATTGVTAVPPLIAFGFVLALLYERTGSLGPPIILHAMNNGLALAVAS
jgi:membrane protease YdiL (CAAX protease family)/uncharacterized RDD family membrane protein YckC